MSKNILIYSPEKFYLKKKDIYSVLVIIRKEFNFRVRSLEINFINRDELRTVNISFLQHYYDTDIITFDYSENSNFIEGELLISIDDAESNAKKFKVTVQNELIRLVIHGMLHLLGFDDKNVKDKKTMFMHQEKLLRSYYKIN